MGVLGWGCSLGLVVLCWPCSCSRCRVESKLPVCVGSSRRDLPECGVGIPGAGGVLAELVSNMCMTGDRPSKPAESPRDALSHAMTLSPPYCSRGLGKEGLYVWVGRVVLVGVGGRGRAVWGGPAMGEPGMVCPIVELRRARLGLDGDAYWERCEGRA